MFPSPFTYHRPAKVEDAVALLARYGDDAAPYAGGTELLLAMKMGFAQYDHLVDLKRVPELRGVALRGNVLSVGALARHAEIASDDAVREAVPALAKLCGEIANPRVRSAGTIGGNLCFAEPRADPPTYERIVFGHRTIAGAAASITADSAQIWVGCVAAHPSLLPKTEALLATGPDATEDGALREALAQDLAALDIADDEDASADYRRHLAATVALRAIAACRETAA
jgi:CO/xanthine dehydrogenase FAD-binding subunit